MNLYEITVVNNCGCLIACEQIEADSENEAMIIFLKDNVLYTGDKITIE